MVICYIGIGANLDDPSLQIKLAIDALGKLPQSTLLATSAIYGSKPLGPQDQPDYQNAVAKIETQLEPLALLDALQAIETQQGRVKLRRWGERCIDLDILLYGQQTFNHPRLTIPHIELKKRSFVVTPLREIAPDLVLPDGCAVAQIEPEFGGDLVKL